MHNPIYTDAVPFYVVKKSQAFLKALYECPIGYSFFWPESVQTCNTHKALAVAPFRDKGVVKMKSATENGVQGVRCWVNAKQD